MPTSFQYFKQEVRDYIVDNIDINKKILDVGAGIGTYSDMLKNYGYYMDCVEIYGPYVSNYQLDKKYNNVFIQSIVGFHFDYYEFIIMGDVLEHLSVEDAQSIIRKIVHSGKQCLVAVPYLMEQGEHEGNIHEAHLQPDLTPEVMGARYPELQLLYANQYYGYYVNKTQKHEKAYLLYADDSYFDLVQICAESIRKFSDIPILVYMLNSDKKITDIEDTKTIRWDCDVKHLKQRSEYIDRSNKSIYKLLIQRPLITKHALENYAETIAYVDSDSVASPYVDNIFTFYNDESSYPFFTEGIFDYLHIHGRGGAESRSDLSTTLEHPACELFNVNQYVRNRYRQTGYYVAGQKTIDFLSEWHWMCNHPAILKNHNYYAPFHEETILNVLMYKRMAFGGLPYCYINGLHKELEFTGHDNLIGTWIKVPSHKEHLLFYHGEKNIEKIKEFINQLNK
jgi:hypothetical protein